MNEQINYAEKYDIFLSYRRDGGEAMAILLRDRLTAKGYNVFLDIESLNSGSFNKNLLMVIKNCTDLIVVCSKNSLDRCVNDGDWVRTEVACALENGKNVVPVMLRGFEFPDVLPDDMEALRMQNGVNANSNEYFDAAIDRLIEKFIKSKPRNSIVKKPAVKLMAACAFILVFGTLITIIAVMLLKNSAPESEPESEEENTEAVSMIDNADDVEIAIPPAPKNTDSTTPVPTTTPAPPESAPENNITKPTESAPDTSTSNTPAPTQSAATTTAAPTAPPSVSTPEPAPDYITIKGTEYSTAIFELDLSGKDLTNNDIKPLRYMTSLEFLDLGSNQISDLEPLSELTNLIKLNLYDNNRIKDLTPLANLKNLENISLYFNLISDLSPLSGLTKLEVLELSWNQITDLTPLANLSKLYRLSLSDNQIADISPLSNLKELTELSLRGNEITDWSPVAHVGKVSGRD
ncbi:MAG: leucine-rich repeat domain-containing protein [Oscillospiraceae bacterium]|nr:leucine-rich repeat domain-containing protein [Oscillospiraceae bacterium]